MALTACPECAHQMSSDATACPQCGKRQWQQPGFSEMTVRIGVAIVALIVILFVVRQITGG